LFFHALHPTKHKATNIAKLARFMKIAPKLSANYSSSVATPAPLELTLPLTCAGQRLDQALSKLLPQYSRNRLAQWIREQQVELDGRPALPKAKVHGGEKVRIVPLPDPSAVTALPEKIAFDVLYEDDALLVINKPPGLVVHPGSGNWSGTLLNALLAHAPQLGAIPRAGIVHRLDKDTSGLLVVAKTLETQTSLVRQLQARTVKREYLALAHGKIARGGKIEAPIGRHPAHRTRMAVTTRGKPAVTYYEVLHSYKNATLLRCRLETGRTHQIRVHLQSINHPLVGDPTYGRRRASHAGDSLFAKFPRQALHAQRLALLHPVSGEHIAWEATAPADLCTLLAALEREAVHQ
jgi:23S rRNA pseudouridine1911/1915/1917 synthase